LWWTNGIIPEMGARNETSSSISPSCLFTRDKESDTCVTAKFVCCGRQVVNVVDRIVTMEGLCSSARVDAECYRVV